MVVDPEQCAGCWSNGLETDSDFGEMSKANATHRASGIDRDETDAGWDDGVAKVDAEGVENAGVSRDVDIEAVEGV